MRKIILCLGAVSVLWLTGCTKEESLTPIKLVPEGMDKQQKMSVDGLVSYWTLGDMVNVNGAETAVILDDGYAYINGVSASNEYCIVFPSSIYSGHADNTIIVDMPSTYKYRCQYNSSNGTYVQILDAPLAYYGTASDGTAIMRHLTGALNVQITRPTGMRIQRIAVSTSQNYVMSGEMQFDMSDLDGIGSSATNATENNTVEMLFDFYNLDGTATTNCTLPSRVNSVQIPIPVLSGNVNFTITVEGILGGTKHVFQRTQTTGGHLGRGEMANVSVNMAAGQTGVTTSALFETTTQGSLTYYLINNAYDFRLMAYAVTGIREGHAVDEDWSWNPIGYNGVDYGTANYLVTDDFDMKGHVETCARGFSGEFNGGSHTISNVVTSGDFWESGLFPSSRYHTIKNVTFNGLKVNASRADEYSMPVSAFGRASLISNVHVIDYEVSGTSYVPQIGGFTASGASTILNSSISFKAGQVINSTYYVRYLPPTLLGGICAYMNGGSPTWQNVTVDFNDIEFRKSAHSGYSYDIIFGGMIGMKEMIGSFSTENINNVTIRGNVTVSNSDGRGNTLKAKVYVNGVTPIDTLAGVDVSGLNIY